MYSYFPGIPKAGVHVRHWEREGGRAAHVVHDAGVRTQAAEPLHALRHRGAVPAAAQEGHQLPLHMCG